MLLTSSAGHYFQLQLLEFRIESIAKAAIRIKYVATETICGLALRRVCRYCPDLFKLFRPVLVSEGAWAPLTLPSEPFRANYLRKIIFSCPRGELKRRDQKKKNPVPRFVCEN